MSSPVAHAHHAPEGFIRKYIFSLDHKVIGIQYYFLGLFSVFVGMALSVLMRYHMVNPNEAVAWMGKVWPTAAAGGIMTPELYLSLMTMHGTIMVFFVLTTVPQSGFGNYFLPIQIGAEDMAFPVLNMMSFWTTFLALVIMMAAFFVPGGAPLSGWTGYPPLSALPIAGPGQGLGQTLWIVSIAVFCGASLMGAINFIATLVDLRCKGMTLMRLPLTCWTWLITAVLGLLGFAVLLAAGVLLILDRHAGTSFFIPGGLFINDTIIANHKGGSPLLWQHLFWFFGHPEVYIAILPGMGVTSQLLSVFARKPIFGYRAMVYAIFSIGFLGFLVWGHHMFMSGLNPYSSMAFATLTMCIGVPSAIKTFNWIGTLWNGKIHFDTAMLFALGFVSLFVTGGVSGIFLGQPSLDLYFHDTYFVVGHFHMIMGVAAIFGMFAGTFYWFPKMFARMMNETLGKIHFYLTFIGVYAIFTPMHYLGMVGNPRRYSDFSNVEYLAGLIPVHQFMSWAAYITVAAQVIFVWNLFWSMKKGAPAPINPWNATTLEWSIPSPPPFDNFAGVHPVVNHGPYEYAVPGAEKDFVMQTDPPCRPLTGVTIHHMGMAGSLTHDTIKGPPPPPVERGGGGDGGGSDGRGASRRASFTGLFVLLAASTMVFAAFTSAFVVRRGLSDDWGGIVKPGILFVNTAILLASSGFLDLARRALKNHDRGKFNLWWTTATCLGVLFLVGQALAWQQLNAAGVFVATNPSSSFFYLLTASHALHLLGGVAALLYVDVQALRLRLGPAKRTAIDITAIFWHFLDGLWLYLMVLFYVWG